MKERITLTVEPEVAQAAKKLAFARRTTVSALVEELLRNASNDPLDFAEKWAGKFEVAKPAEADARLSGLKAKYHLK